VHHHDHHIEEHRESIVSENLDDHLEVETSQRLQQDSIVNCSRNKGWPGHKGWRHPCSASQAPRLPIRDSKHSIRDPAKLAPIAHDANQIQLPRRSSVTARRHPAVVVRYRHPTPRKGSLQGAEYSVTLTASHQLPEHPMSRKALDNRRWMLGVVVARDDGAVGPSLQ
jgi:hypothetical protein